MKGKTRNDNKIMTMSTNSNTSALRDNTSRSTRCPHFSHDGIHKISMATTQSKSYNNNMIYMKKKPKRRRILHRTRTTQKYSTALRLFKANMYIPVLLMTLLSSSVIIKTSFADENHGTNKIVDTTNKSQSNNNAKSMNKNTSNSHRNHKLAKRDKREKSYKSFLKWCQATLGIHTSLEIKEFEYINHYDEWKNHHKQQNKLNFEKGVKEEEEAEEPNKIIVRGLAATRNINIDEVIISVPYHALITIQTTIDHDPVLSQILGPKARTKNRWIISQNHNLSSSSKNSGSDKGGELDSIKTTNSDEKDVTDSSSSSPSDKNNTENSNNSEDDDDTSYYEIGLLIVALLYHRSLGELSPIWFHINLLLDNSVSGINNVPFLWDVDKLRREFDGIEYGPAADEVRRLVIDIKRDVKVIYDEIMDVLIKDHNEIFGPAVAIESNIETEQQEWDFSYERFEWAFAMVNSRKWHLPLADLDVGAYDIFNAPKYNDGRDEIPDPAVGHEAATAVNSMPAQQPTDEFMSLQDEAIRLEYKDEINNQPPLSPTIRSKIDIVVTKHSFMAPLADMLNFGPPCARGRYNTETQAFEVIATCSFLQGQEVTFWYSDSCDEIMIANYGFTHPMIGPCPSMEEWQKRADIWKKYAQSLEKTLDQAYDEFYHTLQELSCNCDDDDTIDVRDDTNLAGSKSMTVKKKRKKVDQYQHDEEDIHGGVRRTKQREAEDLKDL
mmetsp:Transcript_8044/g.9281  ORF Transcript_8044/g.9281 Transcript_8044/m.9281 type:complete len:723 (+) Transcript_8044:178-2346(+)